MWVARHGLVVLAALATAAACSGPSGSVADAPGADAARADAVPGPDADVSLIDDHTGLTLPGPHPLLTDERVAAIDLEIGPASWQALIDLPLEYTQAVVRIDGGAPLTVGIRLKGHHSFCPWPCADRKPALRLDFNRYVPGQAYAGLTHLTLNNLADDPTDLRELLFYALARASYVPAPRVGYAWVRVNGEDVGLYADVETEDKPMMAAWFASDAGDLYEGEFTDVDALFDGKEAGTVGDHTRLQALIDALVAARTAPYRATVAADLDVNAFLRFVAVELVGCVGDGYSIYYAEGAPNNYRIYAPPGEPFRFLPWGADRVWGGFTGCVPLDLGIPSGSDATYPCRGQAECDASFAAAVAYVVGTARSARLVDQLDRVRALLAPYVAADARSWHTPAEIAAAQDALRATVLERTGM